MPTTAAYFSTARDGRWHQQEPSNLKLGKDKKKSSDQFAASGGESAGNHAERLAYAAASAGGRGQQVFLFVQDEFPCDKCKAFFVDQIAVPIIFVCHRGRVYAGEWGLTNPPLPQVIYLYRGKIDMPGKIVTRTWVVPDEMKPWERASVDVRTLQAVNPETCERPADFPAHPALDGFL